MTAIAQTTLRKSYKKHLLSKDLPEEQRWRYAVSWFLIIPAIAMILWQGAAMSRHRQLHEATEAVLGEQFRRAELIVMSSPAAIVMCDEERKITVANITAEEMFGWDPGDLIGRDIDVLIPKYLRAQHHEVFAATMAEVADDREDFMLRRTDIHSEGLLRNGDLIPMTLSVRIIKYSDRLETIAVMKPEEAIPADSLERLAAPEIQNQTQRWEETSQKIYEQQRQQRKPLHP